MTTPKFELENGYALIEIENEELVITNIKVYKQRKGTGKQLIEMIKEYARSIEMPVALYAEPQDNSITDEELQDFYYSCGFELDPCDCDGKLFIYK